jgi:phosphoenolpyruvate carboxykinase (ATP)
VFNLRIPTHVKGVPDEVLNPKNTWSDKNAYDESIKKLAQKFVNNFKKFEDKVPKVVLEMGGPSIQ